MFAEHVDEAVLFLADVVQVDRVDAEVDQLTQPLRVLGRVGGHEDGCGEVLGADILRGLVELGGELEVPREVPTRVPVRHWSWAIASAVSSSSAHERCTWTATGFRPPPPSRNASITRRRTSEGCRTVIRPSAQEPTDLAVSSLTAAPNRGGVSFGRLHTRARSTRTRPSWVTSSPRSNARITSTHSSKRASRSALDGHGSPVTCSFSASPEPRAAQKRPGNSSPSVAIACAVIAGWERCPGAVTTPNGREVACIAAPSHDQAWPEWPCRSLQGARWSEHIAAWNPAASAACTAASSPDGGICSCEAWNPTIGTPAPYPDRPGFSRKDAAGLPALRENHLLRVQGARRRIRQVTAVRPCSLREPGGGHGKPVSTAGDRREFVSVCLVGLASAPPALAQAGTLDTTFGDDGKAMTDFTTGEDYIWDIAVQADQKIVGAGTADGGRYFALARYDTDGTLDDTFGGGGRVTTDMTQSDDLINAVGVQVDQKIVVAGRVGGSGGRYGLARYDAGGILDPTFSGDGKVFTNIVSGWDHPYGLAIQPDGKIVAVGATQVRGGAFSVIRYNANGTLDGSFSGDGKLTTNFTSGDDWARDVALQVDGKIVVSGVAGTSSSNKMAALARYNANGTLDGSFSGDGKVTKNVTTGFEDANGVGIQLDGKIVTAGSVGGSGGRLLVLRFNANGSLDGSFSGDGIVTTNFTTRDDWAWDMTIQADGKAWPPARRVSGGVRPETSRWRGTRRTERSTARSMATARW